MSHRIDDPARILAMADRAERAARGAESLRATIRIRGRVFWHIERTLSLWSRNVILGGDFKQVDEGELDALYDALAIVRDRKQQEALDLRARIEVKP